jgi:hypothetical protein
MPHLLRIIYASRATEALDPPLLEALMQEALPRNEAAGISGILCGGRGYFLQALEGPQAPVMSCYASILRDARHHQVTLLSIGLVSSRAFPRWATAFVEGEALGAAFRERLVDQVLLDRDPAQALKLLQGTLKALRKAA